MEVARKELGYECNYLREAKASSLFRSEHQYLLICVRLSIIIILTCPCLTGLMDNLFMRIYNNF